MSRRLPEAAAGTGCLRHRRSDTILAIRGALYPLSDNPYWLASVQLLDGIGAGIFGALFLLAVADLTHGTGHFNISQGEGATATGLGGALSTAVACLIIVRAGDSAAFLFLAAIAGAGLIGFCVMMPETLRKPEINRDDVEKRSQALTHSRRKIGQA